MFVRQMMYLVAVARERHFAPAAAACHVSQPTLSVGPRKLEEELGIPLVISELGGPKLRTVGRTITSLNVPAWGNARSWPRGADRLQA